MLPIGALIWLAPTWLISPNRATHLKSPENNHSRITFTTFISTVHSEAILLLPSVSGVSVKSAWWTWHIWRTLPVSAKTAFAVLHLKDTAHAVQQNCSQLDLPEQWKCLVQLRCKSATTVTGRQGNFLVAMAAANLKSCDHL